jgi:two-component system sensor histidine kinase PilS (NtrC family)
MPAAAAAAPGAELRRRISQLMLFRVVLITLVLVVTVVLGWASPVQLAQPNAAWLFGIVAVTYALSIGYALWLERARSPIRFADAQIAADLAITTVLVHVTGGAQSAYTFFYPLSIIAAALVRYRRGAVIVAVLSVALYAGVSLAGWLRWLPTPGGQRLVPWDLPLWPLVRTLVMNAGAFGAVAFLAAYLGQQLAHAGERLETQQVRTAQLAALNEDIIRCLSSGLVTVDRNGRVLTINEAAAEILGVDRRHAVSQPLATLAPSIAKLMATLDVHGALRRAAVDVGDRTLGVSVSPLTDHQRNAAGRIVNFQDLTELRRMEEQVKRAERLAVLGRVAAGVAHEIRNPLASISGSIELLKGELPAGDDNHSLMEIVLREVDRLNGLVTDLLDYARPRSPAPEAMELAPLVEETTRVFGQDRSTSVPPVRVVGTDVVIPLLADPAQLRQVLWNLLRNAAEATPEGGGEIVVTLGVEDDVATLTVADQGVGIPVEEQERIFEPFYTTKTRGSGLGLPTVHRIVTEHGGTVTLESLPGSGTRVVVRLPVASAAVERTDGASQPIMRT